jgi:hypothetical protein
MHEYLYRFQDIFLRNDYRDGFDGDMLELLIGTKPQS